MSGGSILPQIGTCQAEIEECEQQIYQQERLLEEQEVSNDYYWRRKQQYSEGLEVQDNRKSSMEAYTGRNNVARQFHQGMETLLGGNRRAVSDDYLQKIQETINQEIGDSEEKLYDLRQKLRMLEDNLSNLQLEYHRALQREREAAERAAREAEARQREAQRMSDQYNGRGGGW